MSPSIFTGLSLVCYGINRGFSSCSHGLGKRHTEPLDLGTGKIGAGIALVAAGVFTNIDDLFSGVIHPLLLAVKQSAMLPVQQNAGELAYASAAACPEALDLLQSTLSKPFGSITYKVFDVFNQTIGVTCKNYLPWKKEFRKGAAGEINGIHINDLSSPTGWGIDPRQRPYIAVKYECAVEGLETDTPAAGAFVLSEKSSGKGPVVLGEHGMAKIEENGTAIYCPAEILDVIYKHDRVEFLPTLERFLNGAPLANSVLQNNKVSFIQLAEE